MHCKSNFKTSINCILLIYQKFVRNSGPAWACRQLCKGLGVTMEVRGLENINKNTGGVVLMNHQSALDLLGKKCLRNNCKQCTYKNNWVRMGFYFFKIFFSVLPFLNGVFLFFFLITFIYFFNFFQFWLIFGL